MNKWALAVVILLAGVVSAQTPNYTQSTSFNCNQQTCNGLPLDQGGTWQFILANEAFSLDSGSFYIFGNPGNPGTGGISNVQNGIPLTGVEGTLTFDWAAVEYANQSVHHKGYAVVRGHQTHHCQLRTCWYTLTVDSAQIYVLN